MSRTDKGEEMRVRCIYCDAEAIYYRDSLICCVNPSCRREFTIQEYWDRQSQENKKGKK